jgi:hypothetical protein
MRMGKPGPTWPRFTPPPDVGAVTVLTVAELGAQLASPAGHVAAVDSWARQTWLAWSDQRGEVEELTRGLLADLLSG